MRVALGLIGIVLATGLVSAQASKPKDTKAELAKLEKSYKASKAAYVKKPKDANLKKKYVQATVDFGTATMMSGDLTPKVKYPGALKLYREALKVDPKNKVALENKKMIEDIYRSMGREIPK